MIKRQQAIEISKKGQKMSDRGSNLEAFSEPCQPSKMDCFAKIVIA